MVKTVRMSLITILLISGLVPIVMVEASDYEPDYDIPLYTWVGSATRDELCSWSELPCVGAFLISLKYPPAAVIGVPCGFVATGCFIGRIAENLTPDCDDLVIDLWTFDPFGILGQSSIDPYKYPIMNSPIRNSCIATSKKIDQAVVIPVSIAIPRCVSNDKIACEIDSDDDSYVDCHDECPKETGSECGNGCPAPTESENCGSSSCSPAPLIEFEADKGITRTCNPSSTDRWYKISHSGGAPLGIRVDVPDTAKYHLYVYKDSCGGALWCESTPEGLGWDAACPLWDGGTYYLKVKKVSGTGEYKLHIGKDNNKDGIPDFEDCDDDSDGLMDYNDNCPFHSNPSQEDEDDDGWGDYCDPVGGMELKNGWNLISIPVGQYDNRVEAVLSPIEGKYTILLSYTGYGLYDGWEIYVPGVDLGGEGIFETMEPGRGYWIYMLEDTALILTGYDISSISTGLVEEWNLIGYPSLAIQDVGIALASIEGKYDYIKEYDVGTEMFLTPTEMKSGKSYWIHMVEDATLYW